MKNSNKKVNNQSIVRKIKTMSCLSLLSIVMFLIACSNDTLISSTAPSQEVFTGIDYETNTDEEFLRALQQLQDSGRGNIGNPDFDNEGEMYYITSNGTVSEKLTFNNAVSLVKQNKWIDVNGSGTSLEAAKESTTLRAKTLGVNMVLVYIAQGMNYWDAEDQTFKDAFKNLVEAVTKNGTKIYAMSHSWSGHILVDLLRNNKYVTHFAINPAHGNLKEGEMIADYVDDLLNTVSPTYIMAGTSDPVARLGGGTAWKEWWGIAGYNSVYKSAAFNSEYANSKVQIKTVKGADHMIDSMIKKGAFDQIKSIIK